MKIKRSPLFYVGDKYKIIEQIKAYFPNNIKRFIEPFVGGGSVFLNIEAEEYCLNDLNTQVYNIHKFLQSSSSNIDYFFELVHKEIQYYNLSRSYLEDIVPKDLKLLHKKTYYSKFNAIGYEQLKKDYNNSKKDYLKLYLLIIYGFNRIIRFNSSGLFNVPPGNVDFNKNVYNSLIDYFTFTKDKNIKFYNLDYKEFLKNINIVANDFIYFDPPYLISQSEYNKLWSNEKEKEFLDFLDELNNNGIKFAVSNVIDFKGNTNVLFKNWAENYNIYEIKSNYISYHDNQQKIIREVLVTNYKN